MANIAFVGGTLVPIGGHNVLEAAAVSLPVVTGPHLHKCAEVSDAMLAANAMVVVEDHAMLTKVLLQWIQAAELRQQIGGNGLAVVAQNQGATNKILTIIQDKLKDLTNEKNRNHPN